MRRGVRAQYDLPDPLWRAPIDPAIWAIVVNGVLGTVLFAMALQRGRVTVVAAVSDTTSTVVPSVIGLVFLGDQVRSGFAVVATAGFLIAVSGAIALARFTEPLPATPTGIVAGACRLPDPGPSDEIEPPLSVLLPALEGPKLAAGSAGG